jgi:hypothetical protein
MNRKIQPQNSARVWWGGLSCRTTTVDDGNLPNVTDCASNPARSNVTGRTHSCENIGDGAVRHSSRLSGSPEKCDSSTLSNCGEMSSWYQTRRTEGSISSYLYPEGLVRPKLRSTAGASGCSSTSASSAPLMRLRSIIAKFGGRSGAGGLFQTGHRRRRAPHPVLPPHTRAGQGRLNP